ncbi:MAG: S24 family peptidase [Nitrospinota bacterium]|nr:S24 family peptidase [Nitrospinota bacterium]
MVEFLPLGNWLLGSANELKFVAKDNSMAPMIAPGEILIVDKSMGNFNNVLIFIHQGKMLARRVRRLEEGGYELVPDNPDFPTIKVERVIVVGQVVATGKGT